MSLYSVNDAINLDSHHNGNCIEIEGILSFENEDISLNHSPKAERKEGYSSSIWLDEQVTFRFNERILLRWSAKKVIVLGELESISKDSTADGFDNGFGHFSLWPTRIKVRRIDLVKKRNREHF